MAAGRAAHFESHRLQQLQQQFPVGLLVIDDQQFAPAAIVAARLAPGGFYRRASRRTRKQMHFRQKQPDAKHRTFARRAHDRHFTAHQVRHHLGDRQAQAGA